MFGDVIRDIRMARGHTQVWVAGKLGLSKTQLTRLESNTYEPNLATIRKFARFFRISADTLLELDTDNPETVSAEEFVFMEKLRRLSPDDRQEVARYMEYRQAVAAKEQKQQDKEA